MTHLFFDQLDQTFFVVFNPLHWSRKHPDSPMGRGAEYIMGNGTQFGLSRNGTLKMAMKNNGDHNDKLLDFGKSNGQTRDVLNVSTTDGNTTCLAKKDQLLPLGIMMIEHYEIVGYQIFRQTHKGMIFPKI